MPNPVALAAIAGAAALLSTTILAAAAAATADPSHGASAQVLTQPGQATFAAISETVQLLSSDPATDWSKVNIDTLRAHLVDMDNVFARSTVHSSSVPDGARFRVTGDATTAASIKAMTGAHFATAGAANWKVVIAPLPNGVDMTVTSTSAAEAAKIRALGFYGLMALGDHHARHHLMLARAGSMSH